jgi:hypothetical protein
MPQRIKKQLQSFFKPAEKHLCLVSLSALWLRCKHLGSKGGTNFLNVALNGKKVRCLQSERSTLIVQHCRIVSWRAANFGKEAS